MTRHARNQLVLDLDLGERPRPSVMAPEGLLQALADLLLEALGKENKEIPSDREACDAAEDHA
jgi:hypothetical protein